MEYKDYYEILGLDKNATKEQIKKTYRKLAKKYHPDANPSDKTSEERFKEINEAYEVLGDEEKRKKYDQFGHNLNFSNGYDFDPSQFGFGNNARYEYSTGNNGFSDFFNMVFGDRGINLDDLFGGAGRSSGFGQRYSTAGFSSARGDDLNAEIQITPEEGYHGGEKRISLNTGAGTRTISFKIPPGISDGGKIKLSGQGGSGYNNGGSGDLYLKVSFMKSQFELKENDLYKNQEVYPWVAALGGEVTVQTIDEKIKVKIPRGIQTDHKMRIPGKGYRKTNGRGDLFLVIKIVNPKTLSKEQKRLYEELAKKG